MARPGLPWPSPVTSSIQFTAQSPRPRPTAQTKRGSGNAQEFILVRAAHRGLLAFTRGLTSCHVLRQSVLGFFFWPILLYLSMPAARRLPRLFSLFLRPIIREHSVISITAEGREGKKEKKPCTPCGAPVMDSRSRYEATLKKNDDKTWFRMQWAAANDVCLNEPSWH
ncbi:hypothetical protein IF1G_06585 [Cordyceps javanica]|uniref:Uncharacterized protein n=1 Tax=Cordyceps javanica TaxID=43265 RepID=A0A545UYL6_9HYPO|nr:hypothetical protein IF1G_06585 [Cordyceps javanica]